MPLLFIHEDSDKERKVLLWFSETGKAAAADWGELQKRLREGYDIVTFDFRAMGETRMPFTALSPDDPALGKPDFDQAYANALSGVLANHVYNSLLTGRPYFFEMIEDAEIADQFAKKKLGRNVTGVTAEGANYTLASAIAEVLPGIKLLTNAEARVLRWSDIIEQKQEAWPIQFLVPGGAYIN